MRNKRFFVVLAGALVFGLLAAVSVSRYLSNAQAFSKDMKGIAVAKVAIPLGTKIIPEQVMLVQFPKESMPDGTFDKLDKLTGRVAVVNIAAREPITDSRLAPEGTAGGLSAVIPEGYRAMTVKVDDVVGISGFIMPGTLVDVVVVITPEGQVAGLAGAGPISKIVLQNIKVLANGQNIDKPDNQRDANSVKAVTLQVTPEQAEKLALASSEGRLQLVMRNSIDQGDEQTTGVNKRTLLGGEHASPAPEPGSLKSEQPKESKPRPVKRVSAEPEAKPAAPAAPRTSVEVIEGTKKRSVDFP